MQTLTILKGAGLLVGMIVGAGMFALPYAVSQAGLVWSLVHLVVVGMLVVAFHFLYGEALFGRKVNHRLPGYIRYYYGEAAYWVCMVARVTSYFGFFLAYGVLGGVFLSQFAALWGVEAPVAAWTVLLFFALAFPLAFDIRRLGTINLYLAFLLVAFPVLLFAATFSRADFSSVSLFAEDGKWFLPYGIFLFAFSGASVIPEVRELFGNKDKKGFRIAVIGGTLAAIAVYLFFVVAVLGIGGANVSPDALSAVRAGLGSAAFVVSLVVGMAAIITSYFALGLELRYTFEYDLDLGPRLSWALVAFAPLALYIVGVNDFIAILSLVGAFGIGIEGAFIALLAHKTTRVSVRILVGLVALLTAGALLEIAELLILS